MRQGNRFRNDRTPEGHARQRARKRQKLRDQRVMLLRAYGNQCACCGEATPHFLTFDHINGDGRKERPNGKTPPRWVKEQLLRLTTRGRRDDLQILCWNCNVARGQWGYCHDNPQTQLC